MVIVEGNVTRWRCEDSCGVKAQHGFVKDNYGVKVWDEGMSFVFVYMLRLLHVHLLFYVF